MEHFVCDLNSLHDDPACLLQGKLAIRIPNKFPGVENDHLLHSFFWQSYKIKFLKIIKKRKGKKFFGDWKFWFLSKIIVKQFLNKKNVNMYL